MNPNPRAILGSSKREMNYLYDFSGGMESAAMLAVCRDEILSQKAIVRWADTGRQFPEMADSIAQIESILGIQILRLAPPFSFDEYLYERGGMLRQGFSDCSKRMKRRALREHANSIPMPQRIALGFNAKEVDRGVDFCALNNTAEREFVFPLQERNITRAETVKIAERNGFTILVSMYRKMGRFDCYFCPNQRIAQAEKVMTHYPALWADWKEIEKRKGHPILKLSAVAIEARAVQDDFIAALDSKQSCACMGGNYKYDEE